MNQTLLVAIVAVVIVVAIVAVFAARRRRSAHLKEHFGPEYERAVAEAGSPSKAEAELAEREKRVDKLDIRPLDHAERDDFMRRWAEVQARFVDDPPRSVAFADALLGEVMKARGYPVSDFDQRAGDISVEHPHVVEHYRTAHEIAVRHERGQASTEDLRQAMIHYRALFDELVGADQPVPERQPEPAR
jgi:hypothetical protein